MARGRGRAIHPFVREGWDFRLPVRDRRLGTVSRSGARRALHPSRIEWSPVVQNVLKNIRVAVRLPVVIVISLVSLVVLALVAMSTIQTVRINGALHQALAQDRLLLSTVSDADLTALPSATAAREIVYFTVVGDPAQAAASADGAIASIEAYESAHAEWATKLTDQDQIAAVAQLQQTGDGVVALIRDRVLPAHEAGDADALVAAQAEVDRALVAHEAEVGRVHEVAQLALDAKKAEADAIVSSRNRLMWTLLIATLAVVGAAAWMVTRSVLKPLGELRSNMDEIASGDGSNSDARLDAGRRDEFGDVASSFNTFADKLVAYSDEVARNARTTEANAIEVSQAAAVAAENMNTVAVATTELSAAASEIARSAGDASRTAQTAVTSAANANELMQRLADSSARIGEVVESIRGIAAQTTMLALNATIEAARAGDAGRGFAVVASEVKDLAAETGTATGVIVGRVDEIQADAQAALLALAEVVEVISDISSTQSVIAAAVEEQAATTAEIDRSLTEAVTAVNQIAGTSHVPAGAVLAVAA